MFEKIKTGQYWDEGWKLVEGCNKVSPACDNCWALAMDKRFGNADKVAIHEERLSKPLKRKKPTVYAIWNDLFHEEVSNSFINKVLAIIALCPQHIFIVLTKRPERMCSYVKHLYIENYQNINLLMYDELPLVSVDKFPLPNLWLGVTAENQEQADKRIPLLIDTPAAKRIVSIEPMLGEVDLVSDKGGTLWIGGQRGCAGKHRHLDSHDDGTDGRILHHHCDNRCKDGIDWVICGGETGKKARPMNPEWVHIIQEQCEDADVPFCFKSWGEWFPRWEWEHNPELKLPDDDTAIGQVVWRQHKDKIRDMGNEVQYNIVHRVGKAKSGRLIRGIEYNEMLEYEVQE